LSNLFVDKISGKSGTSSGAPITLSGDTATLGSGVTVPAAGITGVLPSDVTGGSGLNALPVLSTAEMWTYEGSDFAGSVEPITGFERISEPAGYGGVIDGSGITVDASTKSIFTFPSEGHWWIYVCWTFYRTTGSDRACGVLIQTTVDGDAGSPTYVTASFGSSNLNHDNTGNRYASVSCNHIFDVTSTSTHKFRLGIDTPSGTTYSQNTANQNRSNITFFRLGDT